MLQLRQTVYVPDLYQLVPAKVEICQRSSTKELASCITCLHCANLQVGLRKVYDSDLVPRGAQLHESIQMADPL